MEMQVAMFDGQRFQNYSQATEAHRQKKPESYNAILVFVILFEISQSDNENYKELVDGRKVLSQVCCL